MLIVPLGEKIQIMTRITKLENGEIQKDEFMQFAFVPMLKGTAEDK